jgi:hypothetical protein
MNKIKNALKRQLFLFLIYLAIFSLFLFNKQGGADMVFGFFMTLFILGHFFSIILNLNRSKKIEEKDKWTLYDLAVFIIIVVIFILFYNYYLDFFWNITANNLDDINSNTIQITDEMIN